MRELHELYCHWTAQTLSLRFDRERLWYEFLSAGFSAEDLKRVDGEGAPRVLLKALVQFSHDVLAALEQATDGAIGQVPWLMMWTPCETRSPCDGATDKRKARSTE